MRKKTRKRSALAQGLGQQLLRVHLVVARAALPQHGPEHAAGGGVDDGAGHDRDGCAADKRAELETDQRAGGVHEPGTVVTVKELWP